MLSAFLDSSVPWIWIIGHRPNRFVEWWHCEVPLRTQGAGFTGLVRDLCFDLQLPTNEFLSRATEFDDHGLDLIKGFQQMPDTLCLERIADSEQHKVLMHNEATMRIYLPHAGETALVQSFTIGRLSSVIGTEPSDERER